MQAVTVLADDIFEYAAVLKLHEGHVAGRGYRLQRVYGPQVVLAALRHQRPGALWAPKVSDPGGRRDAGAREGDQVLARADPVGEGLGLLVDGGGRLLVLCLGDFRRGVGHLGIAFRAGARRGWGRCMRRMDRDVLRAS